MERYLTTSGLLLAAACVAAAAWLFEKNRSLREENARISGNLRAMAEQCDTLRAENGSMMADCRRIVAERDELRTLYADAAARVAAAGVKLNRAQQVGTSVSATEFRQTVPVRDTVIVRDTLPPTSGKVFEFHDAWTDLRGVVADSVADVSLTCRDTIVQVVYRVPRRWLFFRFGTKAIRQRVTSSNPHSNIIYTEIIEIKK